MRMAVGGSMILFYWWVRCISLVWTKLQVNSGMPPIKDIADSKNVNAA